MFIFDSDTHYFRDFRGRHESILGNYNAIIENTMSGREGLFNSTEICSSHL